MSFPIDLKCRPCLFKAVVPNCLCFTLFAVMKLLCLEYNFLIPQVTTLLKYGFMICIPTDAMTGHFEVNSDLVCKNFFLHRCL